MARKYLSSIDNALLKLDHPTNLMMMTGVLVFESPIEFERLKATLEVRLLGMRRFRQRLAWSRLGHGTPYWEDDADFDLDYHLQRATLPPPGDQVALQDVVSLLASTPLDLSRPLWQFHLIENYADCCALVLRIHHAVGDGMAMLHVILSMTDTEPDDAWPIMQPQSPYLQRGQRQAKGGATRRAAGRMVGEGFDLLAHPSRFRDLGRIGGDAAADLARFLVLKPEPKTVLKGELGIKKRAAWSAGVPLEDVKTIRRVLRGTVNDVMLTIIAGALRRYLQDRGELVDNITIRAVIPVNVRPPGREGELGNQVGAVFVTLPTSIPDPVCRLGEIVRLMNSRKESSEAPVFFALLHLLGQVPARISNKLIGVYSTRATAVMTNVRGPGERLYMAGSPLSALLPWAPTTGRMGLAVSILSYAGQVQVGILIDEGLVPDPEAVISAFHLEFEALLERALETEQKAPAAEAPAPPEGAPAAPEAVSEDDHVQSAPTRPEDAPPGREEIPE